MRVDLLLVLSFDNENNRHGDEVVGVIALRDNQLWCGIHRQLRRVLQERQKAMPAIF